jgi:hypothetical protein
MNKVTIYRFRRYDIQVGTMVLSPRWGTLEAIKAVRGTAMVDTAIEVDSAIVDTDEPGMTTRGYHPSQT